MSTRTPRARVAAGVGLGAAMATANVVGYLFVLLVSRSLGPERFGGLSALSAWGIVLSVPAGALQVVVARHVANGRGHGLALRWSVRVGAALAAVTIAMSPWLASRFGLDSAWSVVWLAGTLAPVTVVGWAQGALLGSGRIADLAVLYLVGGLGRLAVGVVAVTLDASVTAVFALLFAASLVTLAVGALRARRVPDGPSPDGLRLEIARSTVSLGAFIALTNVDVLLARTVLDSRISGGYALASTFGRAIGWGTQFIALLVVPRVQGGRAARALALASAVTATIGVAAVGILAVAPRWWMRLAGGVAYERYGDLAVACAALGTLWALAQLWLFADMGRGSTTLGALAWLVVGVQVAVVHLWWHDRPGQIVLVCATGAAVIVLTAVAREARRSLRSPAILT